MERTFATLAVLNLGCLHMRLLRIGESMGTIARRIEGLYQSIKDSAHNKRYEESHHALHQAIIAIRESDPDRLVTSMDKDFYIALHDLANEPITMGGLWAKE